jgi:hypothetical protein
MREEIIIPRRPQPESAPRRNDRFPKRPPVVYDGMFEKFFHESSAYETLTRYSDRGARTAFNELQQEIRQGLHAGKDVEFFTGANRYVIFSTHHHETMEELEEKMTHCDTSHIGPRTVGCLILGEQTYVFFWLRSNR